MIESKIKIGDLSINFEMPDFTTESPKIDVDLYTLKPWRRFVPHFLYPLFKIYPTRFKKCEIMPGGFSSDGETLNFTVNVSYQEIEK